MEKNCKKCGKITKHRWIKDNSLKKLGYYHCSVCSEIASKKHRKKYWLRYLAQKANSRKREGSEKMTEEMLININYKQQGKCALTGIKMDINSDAYKPSLDRIDSTKGYTLDNIQLISNYINKIKREFDQKLFIDMCYQVALEKEILIYPHYYHINRQE